MISFRPVVDGRYVRRPRLLDLMPDTPGYVVLLEAPYGYGKSVLASQWAGELEEQGWRTIWLAMEGSNPKQRIASALNLPVDLPWAGIFDTLWSERTLLVLEDLESLGDDQDLTPLLRQVHGLLLLASRTPLATAELPKLVTQGRLLHLRAADLSFTESETAELVTSKEMSAERLHSLTGGWPLPLHYTSLTGQLPEGLALVEGISESLTAEEFRELLLLACVAYLPDTSANETTRQLAGSGFIQAGESGYRLHRMIAEALLEHHRAEATELLRNETDRVPALVLGEAAAQLGDQQILRDLLSHPRDQIYRQAPELFIRWSELLTEPLGAVQQLTVGAALKSLGRHAESAQVLKESLRMGNMPVEDTLFAYKELAWSLAVQDNDAASEAVKAGEELLNQVGDELAGRFLSDAAFVDIVGQRFEAAAQRLERALARLPRGNPYRTGPAINLALNRWDAVGDLDGRLALQEDLLETVFELYPSDAPGQCRDVAMLHAWLGNREKSRHYFERAAAGALAAPLIGIEASAALASEDGNREELLGLVERARLYGDQYTLDIVTMYAIAGLASAASPLQAEELHQAVNEPRLATAALAPRLAAAGRKDEALQLLDSALAGTLPRAGRVLLQAARYRVSRQPADLEELMELTLAGDRILPGLVPLHELPKDRPELARSYPLHEVLESDWQDAIALRSNEVPPLKLSVLGRLEARVANHSVELTQRHWQILLLLLIGHNREEVAERVWPEVTWDKQRNNLSVQFTNMRKRLEPWGVATYLTEEGLRRYECDLSELLAALEDRDVQRVNKLYRDPFAPGISHDALAEYRNWLREQVSACLLEGAAEQGAPAAEKLLRRVRELEPLNETAVRQLISCLMTQGKQVSAHQVFEKFRDDLMREFDLEPQQQTVDLLQAGN